MTRSKAVSNRQGFKPTEGCEVADDSPPNNSPKGLAKLIIEQLKQLDDNEAVEKLANHLAWGRIHLAMFIWVEADRISESEYQNGNRKNRRTTIKDFKNAIIRAVELAEKGEGF